MAFIPVPDTIKAALVYTAPDNQTIVNTMYFEKTGGGVVFADLGIISTAISSWYASSFRLNLPLSIVLDRIELRDLTTVDSFVRTDSVSSAGNKTGAILPLSTTKRINFGTGFAGRSFRGANYFPAFTQPDVSVNDVDSAVLLAIENSYKEFIPPGTATPSGFEWVVVSLYTDNAPRLFGVTTPINQVYTAGTDVDVIRSRVRP